MTDHSARGRAPDGRAWNTIPLAERLDMQTRKIDGGCWEWTGNLNSAGYGTVSVAGRRWSTHRLSYTLHNGPIPAGVVVMHSCDVRHCVNPEHLSLGSVAENNRDAYARGGKVHPRGEDSWSAKLTDQQVLDAIRRVNEGETRAEVARSLDVHQTLIGEYVKHGGRNSRRRNRGMS